jgi:ribosomal protein S18 acetylase RimI-like enzyme
MLSFRPAVAADVPALAEVARQAYAPYVERMGEQPAPMTADYDAVVAGGEVWVAEDDQRIIGMLSLVAESGYLLVENVAVVPEAQGKGVGNALMRLAEDRAAASGLAELRLYTNAVMTENLHYYPRRGYVETHRGEEGGFQRVFFRKRLSM